MIQLKKHLFLILLLSQGCTNSSLQDSVHPELEAIVDAFMAEATSRGVKLDEGKGDFIVQFGRIKARKAASCKPNYRPKIITIDSLTWQFINAAQKESLVFHELAHCLLKRAHNNESFEYGECKSWMREDESSCHINLHNAEWREYYLDELFRPSGVPVPYWYDSKPRLLETADRAVAQRVMIPWFKFAYFDSTVINSTNDWIIDITGIKPESSYSSVGVRINELVLETSFPTAGVNSNGQDLKPRMVVSYIDAGKTVLEVASEISDVKLSLQKIDKAVYIYFANVLHYRYPVGDSDLKIGAYCSFPEDSYRINLYIL